MTANAEDMAIATAIGEVKGQLGVLLQLTQQNNHQLNKRMDDLTHAVNQRIDDHNTSNNQQFLQIQQRLNNHDNQIDERKHDLKKSTGSGALAGVIVSVGVEIARQVSGG